MSEAQQILQMLQEGRITADEASALLAALREGGTPPRTGAWSRGEESPAAVRPVSSSVPAELKRFRRLCQVPFFVSLGVLVLSGWGLYALYRQAGYRIAPGVAWMLAWFILVTGVTALAFWMRLAPWLHVRVQACPVGAELRASPERSERVPREQGKDRKRIAISLPLPLTLADWGIRLARRFVDDETARYLDMGAGLLKAMRGSRAELRAEPIAIDVNEGNEHVQVYIG